MPRTLQNLILCLLLLSFGISLKAQSNTGNDTLFILNILKPRARTAKDSLWIDYNQTPSDSAKIILLVKSCLIYPLTKDEARVIALKALQLARQSNYRMGIGLSHMVLAGLGKNREAVDSSTQEALRIFKETGSIDLGHLTMLRAAMSLTSLGENYVEAFRLLTGFITDYSIKSDSRSFARAWNLLGEIYRLLENNEKALECYRIAVRYSFVNNQWISIAPLINIGTVYKNMGNYDSAFFYYDKVLDLDTTQNISWRAYIDNRKAQIHFTLKDYTAALQYAEKSIQLYKKLNNEQGIVLTSSTFTQIYFTLGQFRKCIQYGEQAVNTGKAIEYLPGELQEVPLLVAKSYEFLKEFDKAALYFKTYIEIRDKIFGPSANLAMFNEQLKLETRNQQLEKTLMEEKQKQSEKEAQKQRLLTTTIGGVLVLSILATLLLYRKNLTIKELNTELSKTQVKILGQAEKLEAANKELEAFTYSVSHDLRAPLRSIAVYSQILREEYNKSLDHEGQRITLAISKNAGRMEQLIDDLLNFSRTGRKGLVNTSLDMELLVSTIIQELTIHENGRILNIKTLPLSPSTGDLSLLRQVWVNLISNALKYTSKNKITEIEIGCKDEGDYIIYHIRDNGAGFDMKYINKLFGVFHRLHRMEEYEGTGVGLALVRRIIELHGGDTWAEGKTNEGATFYFTLPKTQAE